MINRLKSAHQQSAGFTLKKFHVSHDLCGMKVGTDGILLGAWAPLPEYAKALSTSKLKVLDIGTGSGLINLMIAQRCAGEMHGISLDIDANACKQAAENIHFSPWPETISVVNQPLQTFVQSYNGDKFDLIVSNPPYFPHGQIFEDPSRQQARHTNTLSHLELVDNAIALLHQEGIFALILPFDAAQIVVAYCESKSLIVECTHVRTTFKKPCKRILLSVKHNSARLTQTIPTKSSELIVHHQSGSYSDEYINLTRDFYINM